MIAGLLNIAAIREAGTNGEGTDRRGCRVYRQYGGVSMLECGDLPNAV